MNTRRSCGSDSPVCRQYSASLDQSVGEPNDVWLPRSRITRMICLGTSESGRLGSSGGKMLPTPKAAVNRLKTGKSGRSCSPPRKPNCPRNTASCSVSMRLVKITPFGRPVAPDVKATSAGSSA